MRNNENIYGVSKKSLSVQLYRRLIDEDAVSPEDCNEKIFTEFFEEILRDYGLFLKTGMIE